MSHDVPAGPDPHVVAADLASIDAADTDLVLRRAVQLADDQLVVAERLSVGDLEQAAAELHVPASAVADALAEYRAGAIEHPIVTGGGEEPSSGRGVMEWLFGPAAVKVRGRTGLSDDVAVENLSHWLRRRHHLDTRVRADGTVVAVRRRGIVTSVVRNARSAVGRGGLDGVREVRAAAVSTADGVTSLCVVADVSDHRTQSVVAGSAVAASGTIVVGTVALLTGPVGLVGVPVAVGAGWVTSRLAHRSRVKRVAEAVESTADNVAAGARPPSLSDGLAERLSGIGGRAQRENVADDPPIRRGRQRRRR